MTQPAQGVSARADFLGALVWIAFGLAIVSASSTMDRLERFGATLANIGGVGWNGKRPCQACQGDCKTEAGLTVIHERKLDLFMRTLCLQPTARCKRDRLKNS